MLDRLAPFLILLLNQYLIGFAFLFGALLAGYDSLPRTGPWLAAVTVWTVPTLVQLGRSATSEAKAPRLYQVVMYSIRAGYLTLGTIGVLALLLRLLVEEVPWEFVGLGAFVVVGFVEGRHLRRKLHTLTMLDQ